MRGTKALGLLTFMILLCLHPLKAQISDATENLPPFGSFSGGDFDTVSLQNGNLHISIPVLTIKERGRDFTYKFAFDTPTAYATWIVLRRPLLSHYVYSSLGVVGGLTSVEAAAGPSGPFNYVLAETSIAKQNVCGITYWWAVVDPENSYHQLDFSAYPPGSSCGSSLGGPTKDGSGMWVNMNVNPPTVKFKDGTTIALSSGGQTLEDPNGNMASSSSDMLSRNPWTVSNGPGTTYTSPSGKTVNGPQYTLWEYTDSNGIQQQFRFDYEAVDLYYVLNPDATPPTYHNNAYLSVAKLTLPTGASYQFSYVQQSMGQLQQITLPSGGSISYGSNLAPGSGNVSCWQPPFVDTDPHPSLTCRALVQSRTVTQNGVANTWTYSNIAPGGYGGTAVITDPAGNDETHTFQALVQLQGYVSTDAETQVQKYSGCAPANPNCTKPGTVLRTVATSYAYDSTLTALGGIANIRPTATTTTLDNGLTSETQTDYETFTDPAGETATRRNITAFREYDYPSSTTPVRQTKYIYGLNSNSAYTNLNIVDRVTQKTVYDANNNQVAQTVNEYDNYSHANQPMVASGAVQHDPNFNTSFTTRGNLTAVSQWRNTDGALLTTTNQYDDAGNVLSSIDPLSNKTSFGFTDSWSNSTCAPSGQGKAYVTTITTALNQTTSNAYDSCTGVLTSTTDPNLQKTSNSYDLMGRVTGVSYPDGGSASYCYSDVGGSGCTPSGPPYQAVTTKALFPSINKVSTTTYDGLGRVSQTQLNSDPSGTTYTLTTYDALGRKYQVYNPTRCNPITTSCGETSWGYATYSYDPLNRVTSVLEPDGSAVSTSYTGNCSTVTDEAGNQRKSCSDALGRLTGVWEAPNLTSTYNYWTAYTYDTLNNMLSVTQNGSNSASARTRTFTYNSLSQLLCAANPEIQAVTCPTLATGTFPAGAVLYTYDANGNLITKTAPSPNQISTAKTVATNYTYDALNRLTVKSYRDSYSSNPATPTSSYGYDGTAPTGCTPPTVVSPSGSGIAISPTNLIGRRSSMCDGSGATAWVYDSMGRPTIEERTINGSTKNLGYIYFLDGELNKLYYPLPAPNNPLEYSITAAGRPLGAEDEVNNYVFINNGYAPNGALSYMAQDVLYSFSVATAIVYNPRFQPVLEYAIYPGTSGNVYLYQRCYDFHQMGGLNVTYGGLTCSSSVTSPGDNGNVYQISNKLDDTRTQNFFYDPLNRISQAYTNGPNWGQNFTIDSWGNLTTVGAVTGKTLYGGLNVSATATNQFTGYSYDAAGNLLSDNAGDNFTYDAENRIIIGSGVGYSYDGDGQRVEKSTGTLYWRGAGSDTLVESDLGGNATAQYIFFLGRRVARVDKPSGLVHNFTQDHLNSSRISWTGSSSSTIAVQQDIDYTPYGITVGAAPIDHYQFTGKERDSESGLDNFGFRYYASTMGRFMKPDDPFNWNESNPQSLNLYGYVGNNPLNRVDPDGHDCIYIDNDSGKMTGFSRGDCDNSTEALANSGVYVNGTVDVINENSQDQVTGYGATGDAGTAVVGAITPPGSGLLQQASDSWQNFKTDWQLRIDANRPPPQKPSNLDALQYINNIMMGLVPLSPSRGSTGRTAPRDLKEQLAMEQVQANPGAGKKLPLQMNDPRWPASDGWVKMSQNVNGVEVHYVENTTTGQVDDFKFK